MPRNCPGCPDVYGTISCGKLFDIIINRLCLVPGLNILCVIINSCMDSKSQHDTLAEVQTSKSPQYELLQTHYPVTHTVTIVHTAAHTCTFYKWILPCIWSCIHRCRHARRGWLLAIIIRGYASHKFHTKQGPRQGLDESRSVENVTCCTRFHLTSRTPHACVRQISGNTQKNVMTTVASKFCLPVLSSSAISLWSMEDGGHISHLWVAQLTKL